MVRSRRPSVSLTLLPMPSGPGVGPRGQQAYAALRQLVLSGRIAPGMRLPGTRALAASLGVARNTVLGALERLAAEELIECRRGSGCRVMTAPAETRRAPSIGPLRAERRDVSPRPRAFALGLPAVDEFPLDLWARLTRRHWRMATPALLGYGRPGGHRPLREAVAEYLRSTRAVRCTWEQVIIAPGARAALALVARALLHRRDQVWVEDPGYTPAARLLEYEGVRVAPVGVDSEGLMVEEGRLRHPRARAAYVTPSHQFPLGVTMTLARRRALLAWACSGDRWIIEDDYDSEFRHEGPPLAALQGLDTRGRVSYIGTFSKRLLPGIRVAYAVVPADTLETVLQIQATSDRQVGLLDQAVLAEALSEGHLARHARHMRSVYAGRRTALLEALHRDAADVLTVLAPEAGLHVVAWLGSGLAEAEAVRAARAAQLDVRGLGEFSRRRHRPALVLGYGAASEPLLREGVRTLARALRAARRR